MQPFRYRGYVYDEETGLYYLRSRYYNPGWGRFVNADTHFSERRCGFGGNLFIYCKNSPILFCDRSGKDYGESGQKFSLTGVGIQVDFSASCLTYSGGGGFEVICYWGTPEAKELNKCIIAVYSYDGAGVAVSDYSDEIDFITQIVYDSADELMMMGASEMEALIRGKLVSASISGSVMAIWTNDEFKDAYDYRGKFDTITVGFDRVKAFYSWSDSCKVDGLGVQWPRSGLYYNRTASEYRLLYTNGISCQEHEDREKAKGGQ